MAISTSTVSGHCEPKFQRVREEFARNFEERGEVGASVCVSIGGETVVDLWGGVTGPEAAAPWQEDTLSIVWSCTKGAAALCVHMLRCPPRMASPTRGVWRECTRRWRAAGAGGALVNRTSLARMGAVASAGLDAVLLLPTHFSLGYIKSVDNRRLATGMQDSALLGEQAFGHPASAARSGSPTQASGSRSATR